MDSQPIPPEQLPILLSPHPARGPWAIVPQFARMSDGSIRCSGLSISWCPMIEAHAAGFSHLEPGTFVPWEPVAPGTAPNPEELTTSVIRDLGIGSVIAKARAALPGLQNLATAFDQYAANPAGSPHEAVAPRRYVTDPRRKRARLDDAHYSEVASVYQEARKYPRKAVAEHFGVRPATASDYIERCRELGKLPATSRRRFSA